MDLSFIQKRDRNEEEPRGESSKVAKMASNCNFDTEMRKLCIQGHLGDERPQGKLPAEGTPWEREVIKR